MAKYERGIFGNVRGSVGNIQGYNHNNQNIIRQKQVKRAVSESPLSQGVRTKFEAILEFYRNCPVGYRDLLSIYFNPQISVYHSLVPKTNLLVVENRIKPESFWLVDGEVDIGTWRYKTWYPSESLLQIEWDTAAGQPGNVADEDKLYYFILKRNTLIFKFDMAGYERGTGFTIDYYIGSLGPNRKPYIFNFWYRPSTQEFSKSFNFNPHYYDDTIILP